MTGSEKTEAAEVHLPVIQNEAASSPLVLVCEHASNAIPARWGDLGLSMAERRAHIAWDPGALLSLIHI